MTILLWLINTQLGRTVAISVAIIIGVGVGWLIFAKHYENIGYQKALHAIAAQDQKAINEAQHAREIVKQCRDSGRQWSVPDGMCQ